MMIIKKRLIIISAAMLLIISGITIKNFIQKDRDKTGNYAALNGPICPKRQNKQQCQKFNKEGLKNLNAHGSGMINYNDFLPTYKGHMRKVYVVNLIPEEIYYYKNRSLLWYGLGYTDKKLGNVIGRRTKSRIKKYFIRLIYGSPPIEDRQKLQTEREIVHHLGAHYFMPLKNENWLTDLSYMDNLISFFQNLPEDAILYAHCQHGKGRTTTFLVLYDIFKNHKKVPLQDIVNRHYCLGREDLFDIAIWEKSWWTKEALLARKNLAEQFYTYMSASDGYPHQKWSEWSQHKNFDKTPIQIHA